MRSTNGLYFTPTFPVHLRHHSVHPTPVDALGVFIVQYIAFPHYFHLHKGDDGSHLFGTVIYSVSMDPYDQHPPTCLLVNMFLTPSC